MDPWTGAKAWRADTLPDLLAGQRIADEIAGRHLRRTPTAVATFESDLKQSALTIWLTRNWTAGQLEATAIRDGYCVRTR